MQDSMILPACATFYKLDEKKTFSSATPTTTTTSKLWHTSQWSFLKPVYLTFMSSSFFHFSFAREKFFSLSRRGDILKNSQLNVESKKTRNIFFSLSHSLVQYENGNWIFFLYTLMWVYIFLSSCRSKLCVILWCLILLVNPQYQYFSRTFVSGFTGSKIYFFSVSFVLIFYYCATTPTQKIKIVAVDFTIFQR